MSLALALPALVETANSLIDRIFPDKNKQAEYRLKIVELEKEGNLAALNAEVQLLLGQLEINKIDAQSKSFFQYGWRPFIGWVGGASLVWNFIVYQTVLWFDGSAPALDVGPLMALVTALLGVGGMRSFDKLKGTDKK